MPLTDQQHARLNLSAELDPRLDTACDAVLDVLRANPSTTWTPSQLTRRLPAAVRRALPYASAVFEVLEYLVAHAYVDHDNRGAWTHYWLR